MRRSGHTRYQSRGCSHPLNDAASPQHRHLMRGDRKAHQLKNGKAQIARASVLTCCSADAGDGGRDQEQFLHDDTLLDRDILTTNSKSTSKSTLVRCVVAAYERVHNRPLPRSAMQITSLFLARANAA